MGIRIGDVPEHKPSASEVDLFCKRNGIEIPIDYRNFLLAVNGGVPKYREADPDERRIDRNYIEFFYSLGTTKGYGGIELEHIFKGLMTDGDVCVPPSVLPIGGINEVYILGVVFDARFFGQVIFWHQEDIDVESMDGFKDEDLQYFIDNRFVAPSFADLLMEVRRTNDG